MLDVNTPIVPEPDDTPIVPEPDTDLPPLAFESRLDPEPEEEQQSSGTNVVAFPGRESSPEQVFEQRSAAVERQLEPTRNSLLSKADALQVTDAKSYEQAADILKTLTGWIDDAEQHFNPDIERAHKLHKSLCEKRNAFVTPILERIQALKTRALGWYQGEQQRRRAEEQRLQDEARERERLRLESEAKQAEQDGNLFDAQAIREEAKTVEAPPVHVPSSTPRVKGVAPKEKWTCNVHDSRALVLAVGRPQIIRELIEAMRAGGVPVDPVAWLEQRFLDAPDVPLLAVIPDTKYLGGRARNDKNTLKWPGCTFYDEGSMAVRR